jgi:ABC-type Fe3+-hydroxamate transport system substrate-binding protein
MDLPPQNPQPLLNPRESGVPLTLTDQMGRQVAVPFPPRRIISLVPSQTELLFDLGLAEKVVGVTKFCIHPAEARTKAVVIGGTKNFDFDKIASLKPDLIIANKEENYQSGIEQLATKYPVWLSDISNLPEALMMMRRVGFMVGKKEAADKLAAEVDASFAALRVDGPALSAAYFIWRKPYMVAATGTFVDDMLRRAGFANVFAAQSRYPEITPEQLAAAAPQRILLSSEPYPFGEKHIAEFRALYPAATVQIVDGELFSWYGSRLRKSAAYFTKLRQL